MKTKFRMLSALVAVAMLATMMSFGTLSVAADGNYTKADESEVYYTLGIADDVVANNGKIWYRKAPDDANRVLFIKGVDDNEDGSINITGAADDLKTAAKDAFVVIIEASITEIGDGWFDGSTVGAVIVEGEVGSSVKINAGSFKNMTQLREIIIARDNIAWDGLSTENQTVDGLLNPEDAAGKTGGINIFVADDAVAVSLQALDNVDTLAKVGTSKTVNKPFATGIYDITTTVYWSIRADSDNMQEQWIDWVFSDGTLYYDQNEEDGVANVQYHAASTSKLRWNAHLNDIKKIVIGEGLKEFNGGGNWGYDGPNEVTLYPNLEEVVLPNTFEKINAFDFCKSTKLSKINLEDTKVTSIGERAFAGTAITRLELPSTVTTVGARALNTVTDSSSLTLVVNSAYPSGFNTGAFAGAKDTHTPVEIQVRNPEHKASWETAFAGVNGVTVADYDEPVVDADGYTKAGTSEVWYKLATHTNLPRYGGNSLYIKGVDGDEDGDINVDGAAAKIKKAAAGAAAVVIDASITAIDAGWFDETNVGAIVVEGAETAPALTIAADAFSGMPKLRALIIARDEIEWPELDTENTVDGLLNADGASAKTGGINIFIADNDVAASLQALTNGELTKEASGMLESYNGSVTKPFATGIYEIAATDVDWRFINQPEDSAGGTVKEQWLDWVYSDGTLYYDVNEEWGTSTAVFFGASHVYRTSYADRSWVNHLTDIKKIVIGEGPTRFYDYATLGGYWGFAGPYIAETKGTTTQAPKGAVYKKLEEVVLPSTFTTIGLYEFTESTKLSKINLEDTKVTSIGERAFAKTDITKLELPATVTTVAAASLNTVTDSSSLTLVVNSAYPSGFNTGAFKGGNDTKTPVEIQVKNSGYKQGWIDAFASVTGVTVIDYDPLYISALEMIGDEITGYKASFEYEHATSDGTTADQEYVLIIAAYNSAGALVDVEFIGGTMAVGTSGTITTAGAVGDGYTYKAMLWDGFSKLNPLKKCKILTNANNSNVMQ